LFSFRMIGDTQIECRSAHSREGARARQPARTGQELSREAQVRLAWMDLYHTRGRNAGPTCRHFGISRETLYAGGDDSILTTWTPWRADCIVPFAGGSRLGRPSGPFGSWARAASFLAGGRTSWSYSSVADVVRCIRAPTRRTERRPKRYRAFQFGDLVPVDTLDVRPLRGVIWKHYTTRDVVFRWDALQAHTRATAAAATQFLDSLQQRMPFPIRTVQVDGGSEFAPEFEQACKQRGWPLFVFPPRSLKLNGAVERAQRTHTEEFYQVTKCSLEMAALKRELREWEKTYNTVRPTNRSVTSLLHNISRRGKSIDEDRMCHQSTRRIQRVDEVGSTRL
jgi:putative transposase